MVGWKKTPWLGLTNGDVVVVLLVVVVGLKMSVNMCTYLLNLRAFE